MIRHLIALLFAVATLNAFAAVDANKASRAELESVKGIGPSLSTKILEARKTGEFRNWGELVDRVGGIGPGSAVRLSQAGLTVGGAPYAAAAPTTRPATANTAPGAQAKPVAAPAAERSQRTTRPEATGR